MNSPLVSVVIPVFNVEAYIQQCLDSVLNQSYSNLQVIVVDDESPDASIDLVKQYEDPRISIVHQANRGLAGARNTGIRVAEGSYVALLDSDDFWDRHKIARHVAQLQANPAIGVSFSASMFVDEDGISLERLQQPLDKRNFDAGQIFCRNPIGNGSAPVIRRSVLQEIAFKTDGLTHTQYFDERLRQSEDIECWVRIALMRNCDFGYVDEPLTFYRLNSGGLSANVDKQFASWEMVYAKLQSYAPKFAAQFGDLAKAYQYRYLARRLILEGDSGKAIQLMAKAVFSDASILWREPGRSWFTLLASFGLSLVPSGPRLRLIQRMT